LFQERAVLIGQTLKPHTNSSARIAINNLGVHDNLFLSNGNAQQQDCAFANLCLRVEIESAGANVFCAGDACRILAIEENIHYEARAIMMSPLVVQPLVLGKLITHKGVPPNPAASLPAHCTRF
jgi:hypothetical protein